MIYEYPQTFTDFNLRTKAVILDLESYFDFVIPVPCGDCREYFLPFLETDVFWFQFNFAVVTVELKKESDGSVITPDGVTIDGNQFSVDMSELPSNIECFYIEVNGFCRLRHGYEKARCSDTVLIEGIYGENKTDLNGVTYQNGFSNRVRLYAELEKTADETEELRVNDRLTSIKIQDVYELRSNRLLKNQSWILGHLLKSVLRAPSINAEYQGNSYLYETMTEQSEKNNDNSPSWLPRFILKTPAVEQDLICN